MTKEHIESEIKHIQRQIQQLTEMRPLTPLPPVPMLPNLARGSEEMWQIYQYQRNEYNRLMNLPSEVEFLQELALTCSNSGWKEHVSERIQLLNHKDRATLPTLSQPTTSVRPLPYEGKVERAKLIAKHIQRELNNTGAGDPLANLDRIKELQSRLMDLEEQYLDGL